MLKKAEAYVCRRTKPDILRQQVAGTNKAVGSPLARLLDRQIGISAA